MFRAVQLNHALNLREGYGVSILEPMSCLIKGGH